MTAGKRLHLTLRGWGLLGGGIVLALAGELFGIDALRFSGFLLALLPVIALVFGVLFPPRLELERTVYPTTVSAGDRLRVVVELRNKSPLRLASAAYADTVTGAAARSVGGVLQSIGGRFHPREGRRRRRIAYGLSGLRRGIQSVGPLYLEHLDGLGLTRRISCLGEPRSIEVWPQIHEVDRLEMPSQRAGTESEVAIGHSGEADDVVTREYRRGDAMRRVHWRATARAGELQVRQEEHHSETVARILLDTAPAPDERAFELAVSVAASVHTRFHELGYDTEAYTTHPSDDLEGRQLDRTRSPASQPVDDAMRRYMLVEPAPVSADAFPALPPAKAPIVYVGVVDEGADPDAVLDLAFGAGTAVAVLIRATAQHTLAAAEERRFSAAGWHVVSMDASARNPWQVTR